MKKYFPLFYFIFLFIGCKENKPATEKLFRIVPAAESNIYFAGHSHKAAISGGGVAAADINNDGLIDLFFTGDSSNALYLNKGNLKFEDITVKAGVGGIKWSTGVSMADINNDGFIDILVARERDEPFMSFPNDFIDTLNVLLYINNGDLTFTDKAKEFGINTTGPMRHAVFLDYNKDNFLDIYINANYNSKLKTNALQNVSDWGDENFYPDYLFENKEGKKFENVIQTSGLKFKTKFRYGFTPYASDFNNDGWVDLYLNNDFDTPDQMFYNMNGKFTEAPYNVMMQTSFYTMGIDVADINNDGLSDMLAVDMRSDNNYRQKTSWWEAPYDWYRMLKEKDKNLEKQQVKNTLQLNMGNGTYSQISELAGIDATEWSWSPLIADFDNDGFKDIFISNGNIIDRVFAIDFPFLMDSIRRANPDFSISDHYKYMDIGKINSWFVNYIYKNNGDLTFTNKQMDWGIDSASNTNGAAYADLDNDGDIDIILNNNGGLSYIYENLLNSANHNYLRIKINSESNYPLQGTTATIYYGKEKQFFEVQPVKGYLSTSENIIHFGTGNIKTIDSLVIIFPNIKKYFAANISCNKVLQLNTKDAIDIKTEKTASNTQIFNKIRGIGLDYKHEEDEFVDFGTDPLLPQMYSKFGPTLAVGDLNGDEIDDLIVGGSSYRKKGVFIQDSNGKFKKVDNAITKDIQFEDGAIVIFDFDNDGDNDVYVATGGNEVPESSEMRKHRLYLNDGKGNFSSGNHLIPDIRSSSTCVIAADYDNDGDIDLFVGGRVNAHLYPNLPNSYLLKNEKGKFVDVTDLDAPGLRKVGMVSDVIWTDFDKDGKIDLIIVGEWMPVTFFKNNGGKFENVTNRITMNQKSNGFWNCIKAADFDNDGDEDYVLGNLGLNTRFKASQEYPLEMFANDFDNNGSIDIVSAFYENGKLYPCKQLRTLTPRINGLSKKYFKTSIYGNATVADIFNTEKLKSAFHFEVYETATCYMENKEGMSFDLKRLPVEAQIAPVNDLLISDIDNDGAKDMLLIGNFYYAEVERGRYDSFKGLFIKGNGKGNFQAVSLSNSGFVVEGDSRKIVNLKSKEKILFISSCNNDSLVVYSIR